MSIDLGVGLIGAVVLHAGLLFVSIPAPTPFYVPVQAAPASLEVGFVSVKIVAERGIPVEESISEPEPLHEVEIEEHVVQPQKKPVEAPVVESVIKQDDPEPEIMVEETGAEVKIAKPEVPVEPESEIMEETKTEISQKENAIGNPYSGALTKAREIEHLNKAPMYPRVARKRGYEGKLLVKIFISKKGFVQKAQIIRSSGYDILDRSALESVRQWRFEPAQQFGQNIDSVLEIPFTFRLDDM